MYMHSNNAQILQHNASVTPKLAFVFLEFGTVSAN
jgi:hypothetical protein